MNEADASNPFLTMHKWEALDSKYRELWSLEAAGPGQHPSTVKRIAELKKEIEQLEAIKTS